MYSLPSPRIATVLLAFTLVGCPQLLDDSFIKEGGQAGTGGSGGSDPVAGAGGVLVTGGTAGVGNAGAGGLVGTGGSSGGSGGATGAGGTGAAGGSGGSGGTTVTPDGPLPVLVYADGSGDVYARQWSGNAFGEEVLWDETGGEVAYVESRLHITGAFAITAYSVVSGGTCRLHVRVHQGTLVTRADEIVHNPPAGCRQARSFDLAFTQRTGALRLAYADGSRLVHRGVSPAGLSAEVLVNNPEDDIDWVRLAVEAGTDGMALGYTAGTGSSGAFIVREFDGTNFAAPIVLEAAEVPLGSQSFGLTFHGGELLTLRGGVSGFGPGANQSGLFLRTRASTGNWTAEVRAQDAPGASVNFVQFISGGPVVAGVGIGDDLGAQRLGTLIYQLGGISMSEEADQTLADAVNGGSGRIQAEMTHLGVHALLVYPNEYDSGSAVGWATVDSDGAVLRSGTIPTGFEQEERSAIPWSMRVARYGTLTPGVVMVFSDSEVGDLYATHLTSVDEGWGEMVEVASAIGGDETTPFDISGTH